MLSKLQVESVESVSLTQNDRKKFTIFIKFYYFIPPECFRLLSLARFDNNCSALMHFLASDFIRNCKLGGNSLNQRNSYHLGIDEINLNKCVFVYPPL